MIGTILLTWTVVGAAQWVSWIVRVANFENEHAEKLDSPWQWFWAGPSVWLFRFVCYFIKKHIMKVP